MCRASAGTTALPKLHLQEVLPPPLPFCPSTPWTPPKTKASLWSWLTGLLPDAFFACFLSADPGSVVSSSPTSLPDSLGLRAVPSRQHYPGSSHSSCPSCQWIWAEKGAHLELSPLAHRAFRIRGRFRPSGLWLILASPTKPQCSHL